MPLSLDNRDTTAATARAISAHNRRRPCQRGVSILELLIALAIAALLLTATATALDAAFKSYKVNHNQAVVNTAARNSLYQMTSAIRSAWNDPAYDTIEVNTDGTELSLVDASGRNVIYRYLAADRQIQVNIDNGANWYVMIENVETLAPGIAVFQDFPPEDSSFPAGTIGKIIINFKIVQDNSSQSFTASAVPRNIIY